MVVHRQTKMNLLFAQELVRDILRKHLAKHKDYYWGSVGSPGHEGSSACYLPLPDVKVRP